MNLEHLRRFLTLHAATTVMLTAVSPIAASETVDEYQIKSAFICKFGNYVEWPEPIAADPESRFEIGVAASDDVVYEIVAASRGQTVNGRPVAVRQLARGDPVGGLNLIFVARSHAGRLAEILAAAEGRPILTVSESDAGTPTGSMITFVVVDDRVRFDVTLAPAERGRLRISARLLALARTVHGRAL